MDIHRCYELCVQGPAWLSPMLAAVHAVGSEKPALVLHEHFSGTAALSRRWIADGRSLALARSAVAIDLDADVLRVAEERARDEGMLGSLEFVHADVVAQSPGDDRVRADVIFVGNFSIGYISRRCMLVEYLVRCRTELKSHGIFVCDTYDGESSFREGGVTRIVPVPGENATQIRYTWEQRDADRLTARVTCVLHFQVEHHGEVLVRHADAFVYHWRLWSIAELREAMSEAGFASSQVYQRFDGCSLSPLAHGRELDESGIVCIVARTASL